MQPLLVRQERAAKLLAVSRQTITGMLRRGEITAVRVGNRRLIPFESLRQWVVARVQAAEIRDPEAADS